LTLGYSWVYPQVMAHRCGGALSPENTLAGLGVAARLGCRGVEFDVMLSADGSPWLIHDETLERTTNGVGKVCETSDAVLATLDAGGKCHRAFQGTPIPPFADVLAGCQFHGLLANVEIKPASGFEVATGSVVARILLEREDIVGRVVLSSFSEEALCAARQVAPQLPMALLVDRIPADWRERSVRLGIIAFHTDSRFVVREQVAAIKAAGLKLAVYTENHPERARELYAWGVDCMITDRPDLARSFIL
jgi:glycerophosphoryl diester phosphodiesterase